MLEKIYVVDILVAIGINMHEMIGLKYLKLKT